MILIIDSCTENLSVCIFEQDKLLAQSNITGSKHSENAIKLIQKTILNSGKKIEEIQHIIYTKGPGSFTGVRLCQSLAQTLAFSLNKPIIGISTLSLLAQAGFNKSPNTKKIACCIDARMNEVYFAIYENQQGTANLIGVESVISIKKVDELIQKSKVKVITGNGFQVYEELRSVLNKYQHNGINLPNSDQGLRIIKRALVNKQQDRYKTNYIRNNVAYCKQGA